jgi:lipopolysaccharide/colanic/teichoic acid biosynthesis glycosyltransferase
MMRVLSKLYVPAGAAVIMLGLAKFHARQVGEYDLTQSTRFGWTCVYLGLIWLVAYGLGVPDHTDPRRGVRASVAAASIAPVAFAAVQLALGTALLPRFVIAASIPLLAAWFAVAGLVTRGSTRIASDRDRVLVIADGTDQDALAFNLGRPTRRAATMAKGITLDELPAAGGLDAVVESSGATLLVLGRRALLDDDLIHAASLLHGAGLRVRSLIGFYDDWIGKVPLGELERSMLLFDIGEIHRPAYTRLSRLLDVAAATVGCVALAAVTPFVVVGNLLANRGPLLYRQPRVGRNGQVFDILKFRSMTPGGTSEWTKLGDARVTRFGRLLRFSHLDELPQVINILRGDLSIVGPRPEQPRYVERLAESIPYYPLRHCIRPGLTGWAQVNYPYGATEQDAIEKLQYEFWYLRHQSLWLDVRILARTIRHVLGFQGR